MIDYIIPNAFAQGFTGTVRETAVAGRDVAVGGAQSGVTSLISYVATNIGNWIAGVILVIIFWILGKMAAAAIKEAMIKKREDIQESALILIERITKITLLTIGITVAFAINGLNFTAVIGALSLGIGFALKDIIGNFISGVIMLSQDRIKIGDFIKVGEILGTIVSIDTRATILQGVDGTEVVIPNQTMLGETLISYTTNPFRRIELMVGVDYSTDLPMVTSLVKGILDKDEDIVVKPDPVVLVDEFGDSSINLKIRFWVESSHNWQAIRSNLANKIKKAFDEIGVSIPFPITTLKLDEDDRSFLKTMDSMKKGVVPEPAVVPKQEVIEAAAQNTRELQDIPYDIFEHHEKEGAIPTEHELKPAATKRIEAEKAQEEGTPAAPTAPAERPVAETETVTEKEPVAAGQTPPLSGEEKPAEPTPPAPPSHL